ncbi:MULTISPECIES: hypothetical protein [unclassified Curtobacterium]|uniref:hypothetical protein n=1 Tax=unclassified Curtobacterium TaxID=257496 RepID=UPI0015E8A3B6|nr:MULTISPECIES: hypothetical protein [unclassified Curtobacterium]WIB25965.1 hypothetical protein DEJ18_13045 [Curtobacterium sp. MCSS17_015]
MREPTAMHELRADPLEWHRRGLTSPVEIDRIVMSRLGLGTAAEPTYADFFLAAA